jgi:hypothetical protein
VSGLYLEIIARFSAAAEAQGDAPLHDGEGCASAHHQAMNEASAAMFRLQKALGFLPARSIRAATTDLVLDDRDGDHIVTYPIPGEAGW